MPFFLREQADFPTGLHTDAALARLGTSLEPPGFAFGGFLPPQVGGWVSEYRVVLLVLRQFRSGYVFDGHWADGPDGAHLVGEFRPARFSWLFVPLAIGLITLTDLFVPAPQTSDAQGWAPVIWQRGALVAGSIGLAVLGRPWVWKTLVQRDIQFIRQHMQATFPGGRRSNKRMQLPDASVQGT
jgi:hypothetical protein